MKISDYQKKKRRDLIATNDKFQNQRTFPARKCQGCGSTRHHNKSRSTACPAWGQKCHKCGIQNHFASQCRRSMVNEIRDLANLTKFMKIISPLSLTSNLCKLSIRKKMRKLSEKSFAFTLNFLRALISINYEQKIIMKR